MNFFRSITLYLWDYIFSIIDKNEVEILRIICKDFRNISTNYWIQNIPNEEVNNYFISIRKLKFNIRFIILQHEQFDFKKINTKYLLFKSCCNGYLEIVKLLIKNGTNINKKDNSGSTPLIYACKSIDVEIVKLLVKNGANINEKDDNGNTPLIFSSYNGNLEIVKLLIKNGANINQLDTYGWTPLIFSSYNGNLEIVKLLIENGANIIGKAKYGKNALQYAKENNQIEIIKYLENFI